MPLLHIFSQKGTSWKAQASVLTLTDGLKLRQCLPFKRDTGQLEIQLTCAIHATNLSVGSPNTAHILFEL